MRSFAAAVALALALFKLVQGVDVSYCKRKAMACNREPLRSSSSSDGSFFQQGAFLLCGSASVLACVFLCPCLHKAKASKAPEQSNERSTASSAHCSREANKTARTPSPSLPLSESGTRALSIGSGALTFTMAELNRITENFNNTQKLVNARSTYKGKLRDGTVVAVKRCKKDAYDTRQSSEFQNEANMLSNVEHMNLVKFLGYLEDDKECVLVVEYVPNGTLREHLDGAHNVVLDFSTRLDIAADVAHALTYLHLYAEQPIIHRDVKSSNILLTKRFRAKVSDFGFSKVGPSDIGTHVTTEVKGTAGYLDPEYLQTNQLTPKSDVHSFGVLLIEIFSGRRPIELSRPSEERITIRWAFKKFFQGRIDDVLDPKIPKSPSITSVLERLAELAFQCAAPTRNDRPTMKEAGEILWSIRKEYQSSMSHSPTPPRTSSFDPSSHPLYRSERSSPLQSPLQSPLHRSSPPLHSPGFRSPRR